MIETAAAAESAFSLSSNPLDRGRRRSTFYVSLDSAASDGNGNESFCTELKRSLEKMYNPEISACNFDWGQSERSDSEATSSEQLSGEHLEAREKSSKRYGVVLRELDLNEGDADRIEGERKSPSTNTSTPIKLMKSRSRSNILCLPDKSLQLSPLKEKSKTLPQKLSPKVLSAAMSSDALSGAAGANAAASTFPPKYSFLLKSSPKILLNHTFDGGQLSVPLSPTQTRSKKACLPLPVSSSPRKALSFIRRAHSTKLSRSNSLLKSLTTKCADQAADLSGRHFVRELTFSRFEECFKSDQFYDSVKEIFVNDLASLPTVFSNNGNASTKGRGEDDAHSGMTIDDFTYFSSSFSREISRSARENEER